MGLIPRHPQYPLPSLERKKWNSLGGEFGSFVEEYLTRLIRQLVKSYEDIYRAFLSSTTSIVAPATTVESETSFGLGSAVGTDIEYARQDHTHGTPANPVTGHESTYNHGDYDTHIALTTTAHGGVLPSTAFSGLAKISVGTITPGSPGAGDLWVDTN